MTAQPQIPAFDAALSLLNEKVFWRAKYLDQSRYLGHLPFLFWLVAQQAPHVAVTLGLPDGTAHFALCQASDKLPLPAQCHGISDTAVAENLTAYNRDQYTEFSQLHETDLADAAEEFRTGSIDLLIVDQPLSTALLDQLETHWLPKMSDRGILLLAGQQTVPRKSDLHLALGALCNAHTHLTFDHGDGLTLLMPGSDRDPQLQSLLDMYDQPPHWQAVQNVFRRLGEQHMSEAALAAAPPAGPATDPVSAPPADAPDTAAIALQAQALAALTRELEARNATIADLTAAHQQDQGQTAVHGAEVMRLTQELETLAQTCAGLRDDLKAATAAPAGPDPAQLAALAQQQDRLEQDRDAIAADLADRFKDLAALTRIAEDQREDIRDKDLLLSQAQKDLEELTRISEEAQADRAGLEWDHRTLTAQQAQHAAREAELTSTQQVLQTRLDLQTQRIADLVTWRNERV